MQCFRVYDRSNRMRTDRVAESPSRAPSDIEYIPLFGGFGGKDIRKPHYDGTQPVGDGIWVY